MEMILDYCDEHLLHKPAKEIQGTERQMKGELFLRYNRGVLDPLFAPYLR